MKIVAGLSVSAAILSLSACGHDEPAKPSAPSQPCYDLIEQGHDDVHANAYYTNTYLLNKCTGEVWVLDREPKSLTFGHWVSVGLPRSAAP
jgi:hypothetical protein